MHKLACAIAEALTCFNRKPAVIVAFLPACLAFIAIGWALGQVQLFLLILTTALSIDASLAGRMNLLKLGQQAGEVE